MHKIRRCDACRLPRRVASERHRRATRALSLLDRENVQGVVLSHVPSQCLPSSWSSFSVCTTKPRRRVEQGHVLLPKLSFSGAGTRLGLINQASDHARARASCHGLLVAAPAVHFRSPNDGLWTILCRQRSLGKRSAELPQEASGLVISRLEYSAIEALPRRVRVCPFFPGFTPYSSRGCSVARPCAPAICCYSARFAFIVNFPRTPPPRTRPPPPPLHLTYFPTSCCLLCPSPLIDPSLSKTAMASTATR